MTDAPYDVPSTGNAGSGPAGGGTERLSGAKRIRRQQDALHRLSSDEAAARGDSERAFRLITETVSEAMEVDRVGIWLLSDDGRELHCADLFTRSGGGSHAKGLVLRSGDYPRYFHALEEGKVIDADDAFADPRTSEFSEGYLAPLDIRSMLDASIWLRGKIAGVVCHEQVGASRRWHPDEAVFAAAVGHLAAAVLTNAERERAAEVLRESERTLSTLIGNLPGMVYRCRNDRDWTMEFVSDHSGALTGHPPADLVGNRRVSYNDVIHPDDRDAVWNGVQAALGERRHFRLEYRIVTAAGVEKRVWEQGSGVFGPAGELVAIEGFITDVTERARLEEELIRTQKLESLGILAGGIAHDFNNLLTAILGNITLARTDLDTRGRPYAWLEEAERASLRARALTQQLLTFSRGGGAVRNVADVAELVRESATFGLRGAKTRCEFSVPSDLWPAEVDEGQIGQVVHNLVINADQAMPGGGILDIRCGNARLGPGEVPSLAPGDYVKVTVADRGVGIPADHLPKVFDPYFTTKSKGSGLGLAIAYSILKRHDGHITAAPRPGGGTEFDVYLPAAKGKHPRPVRDDGPAAPCKGGRILIMDDEAAVRDSLEAILRSFGCDVVAAGDGAEAVAAYRAARDSGRPFEAVILDLTVPGGMGGVEAIVALRRLDPDVRAIVSSGYSDDPVMANHRKFGFRSVVPKPYTPRQLRDALLLALAPPGPER